MLMMGCMHMFVIVTLFDTQSTTTRQYNKDVRVKLCPFNATHWIKEPEFRHHLDRCPDKAPIDRAVLALKAGGNRSGPWRRAPAATAKPLAPWCASSSDRYQITYCVSN